MKLTDFLKNDIAYLNDTELLQYKNSSCQSGGHSILVNYNMDEMFLQSIKPSHQKVREIQTLPPVFSYKGRSNGSYCAVCGEIVSYPDTIDNIGYYSFSIDDDIISIPPTGENDEGEIVDSINLVPITTTWFNLLNNKAIILDENNDCRLNFPWDNLYWAMVIPDNIGIQEGGFMNSGKLYAISLPNTLTSIKKDVFKNCEKLTHIEFRGTISQWNSIIKEKGWNDYTANYKVYCIDGVLNKISTFNWEEFIAATHLYTTHKHTFSIQTLDISDTTPNLLKINCKFVESYHYGDTIEINVQGHLYTAEDLKDKIFTNTGDILLNNCFVKNTIGNFYIEITKDNDGNINGINSVTFIPSYYLMVENKDSESDES